MDEKITGRALEASIKVGASSWLTTLSIKKYGFLLENSLSGIAYISDILIFH